MVWIFLLLCPLVHYFMMKEFHKGSSAEHGDSGSKRGSGKCH